MEKREYLQDIDLIKGFAIFLVVVGHIVAREFPEGVMWYPVLKERIYLFHMPLFLFVSGAIAGHVYTEITTRKAYVEFVKKRATRLLPAYFLFAGIVFLGKVMSQHLTSHVDNGIKQFSDFFLVFLDPYGSFASYLWFIPVVFLCYSLLPAIEFLSKKNVVPFLLGVFLLEFLKLPTLFAINLLGEYLFIFSLGFLFTRSRNKGERFYDILSPWFVKTKWVFIIIFILALIVLPKLSEAFPLSFHLPSGAPWIKIPVGYLSIPVAIAISRTVLAKNPSLWLLLAKYSFSIYLMNTMAIGGIKAILFRLISWNGANFFIFFPVLLVAGVVGPIFAKKYLFRYFPFIDKITT